MKFFPRFFLLYFLVFHIYFFSYAYGMALLLFSLNLIIAGIITSGVWYNFFFNFPGFSYLALGTAAAFMQHLILYFWNHFEVISP